MHRLQNLRNLNLVNKLFQESCTHDAILCPAIWCGLSSIIAGIHARSAFTDSSTRRGNGDGIKKVEHVLKSF